MALSMMGFLNQEACDPKTLASCHKVWGLLLANEVGRWSEVRGRGEGNCYSGVLLLRQCPALSWAGGGGEVGREGAVALLEAAGKGWRTGSCGQHQQMVSTTGQEGGVSE